MGDSTVRIALIALAMAAVAAALPATAHADEGSYLDRVHAAGIPVTDDKALTLGRAACIDLSNDIPLSAVLAAQNPAMGGAALTAEQNWQLLSISVSELCPDLQVVVEGLCAVRKGQGCITHTFIGMKTACHQGSGWRVEWRNEIPDAPVRTLLVGRQSDGASLDDGCYQVWGACSRKLT
jgi:hypothetical protein